MFIFKRAIKKAKRHIDADETLRKLESFLDENSPQLSYWLYQVFSSQQQAITYAELESVFLSGYENQIRQWQADYAEFINEKLNPMWLIAMQAGAQSINQQFGQIFDDSDVFVKQWLENHSGQLITLISEETRQAIRNVLIYCHNEGMTAKEIAQIIRPTIGLNARQATANLRYRNHVKQTILRDHPRISEEVAEQRAHAAALKYSGKQHRYRADMIAQTELAFAYNRGAHESVRQAVANGLMGRCEKVWSTAGTNRVCRRCRDLSGKVVGFDDKFFDSRFDLGETPPLHPRCRCVIIYREIETSSRKPQLSFTPAKNIKEANDFAKNVLGVPKVSYKGLDIQAANEWNRGLFDSFNKFPELKKKFGFVGEVHERNSSIKKALIEDYVNKMTIKYPNYSKEDIEWNAKRWATKDVKPLAVKKNVIAVSFSPQGNIFRDFQGVTLNRDLAKSAYYLTLLSKDCVEAKFHPIGCSTIRSHLDHEIGHQLDNLLGLRDMLEIQELFESRVVIKNGVEDFSRITEELSMYAWKNDNKNRYSEFIAEAWSEYCNNPNPREIAQKVGEIIEREYKNKFPRGIDI